MSAESDALRDARAAADPTPEQRQLIAEAERTEAQRAEAKHAAEIDALAEQAAAELEAERAAEQEAADQAAADQAAADEAAMDEREARNIQDVVSTFDHAAIARMAADRRHQTEMAAISARDRAEANARDAKRREAAEAAEAAEIADAERLGVEWDPELHRPQHQSVVNSQGELEDEVVEPSRRDQRKGIKQRTALNMARYNEVQAQLAGKVAQLRTITRLAGYPMGSNVSEAEGTCRDRAEAKIATRDADRAKAVGMEWDPHPSTAAERFRQYIRLVELERAKGINQEPPERDTGLEL